MLFLCINCPWLCVEKWLPCIHQTATPEHLIYKSRTAYSFWKNQAPPLFKFFFRYICWCGCFSNWYLIFPNRLYNFPAYIVVLKRYYCFSAVLYKLKVNKEKNVLFINSMNIICFFLFSVFLSLAIARLKSYALLQTVMQTIWHI